MVDRISGVLVLASCVLFGGEWTLDELHFKKFGAQSRFLPVSQRVN
jgi:hypothetical protein